MGVARFGGLRVRDRSRVTPVAAAATGGSRGRWRCTVTPVSATREDFRAAELVDTFFIFSVSPSVRVPLGYQHARP